MAIDSPLGYALIALAAILLFCGLIGVLVWVYSRQSPKRHRIESGLASGVKEHDGN